MFGADVEGKGYLNRAQFMEVMSTVQGELNMSDADLRHVISKQTKMTMG